MDDKRWNLTEIYNLQESEKMALFKKKAKLKSKNKVTIFEDDPEAYGYKWDHNEGDCIYEGDEDRIGWFSEGRDFELESELENVREYFKTHKGPFIMFGYNGLWDGRHYGGDIIEDFDDFYKKAICHDYDHMLTLYDEDGDFIVKVSHHDGTNIFVIREMTKKGREYYRRHEDNYDFGVNEFSKIAHGKGYTKRMNFAAEMYGSPSTRDSKGRFVKRK